MLEAQQAALPQPNPASSLPNEPHPAGDEDGDGDDHTEASGGRQSLGMDDVSKRLLRRSTCVYSCHMNYSLRVASPFFSSLSSFAIRAVRWRMLCSVVSLVFQTLSLARVFIDSAAVLPVTLRCDARAVPRGLSKL